MSVHIRKDTAASIRDPFPNAPQGRVFGKTFLKKSFPKPHQKTFNAYIKLYRYVCTQTERYCREHSGPIPQCSTGARFWGNFFEKKFPQTPSKNFQQIYTNCIGMFVHRRYGTAASVLSAAHKTLCRNSNFSTIKSRHRK